MVKHVPDEYFRQRSAESPDVHEAEPTEVDSPAVKVVAPEQVRDGIAPRYLVLLLVVVLATSFAIGRVALFPPTARPTPITSLSPSPTVSATPDVFDPFDGAVVTVQATQAEGECADGGQRDAPAALVDADASTIWRCRGDGVGAGITFTFSSPVQLVGIRLINGNTVWTNRYLAERRITSLRWTFSDGSYFDQGLAANDRSPQEVRFPEIYTSSITMEVLGSTLPGDDSSLADAVSISALEFLGPA